MQVARSRYILIVTLAVGVCIIVSIQSLTNQHAAQKLNSIKSSHVTDTSSFSHIISRPLNDHADIIVLVPVTKYILYYQNIFTTFTQTHWLFYCQTTQQCQTHSTFEPGPT